MNGKPSWRTEGYNRSLSPSSRTLMGDIRMETRWHICLFGELRLQQGQQVISRFRTQKSAALLAYLACHPRQPHSREVLMTLLWPDHDPQASRNNLSVAL